MTETASQRAEKLYENVYKTVLYLHREFGYMFSNAFQRSLAGKHVKTRIEEGLMRRYGITKYNNIYIQDEVAQDKATENLISIGPDEKSCDLVRTIGPDGEIDKEKKAIFLTKYTSIYEREQESNDKRSGKTTKRGGGDTKPDKPDGGSSSKRSNRPDTGGRGVIASGDSSSGKCKSKGGVAGTRKRVSKRKASSEGHAGKES